VTVSGGGTIRAGRRVGTTGTGSAGGTHEGPNDLRHRPSSHDNSTSRSDSRPEQGPSRRSRYPSRTDGSPGAIPLSVYTATHRTSLVTLPQKALPTLCLCRI